jgi:hypothetical protein
MNCQHPSIKTRATIRAPGRINGYCIATGRTLGSGNVIRIKNWDDCWRSAAACTSIFRFHFDKGIHVGNGCGIIEPVIIICTQVFLPGLTLDVFIYDLVFSILNVESATARTPEGLGAGR